MSNNAELQTKYDALKAAFDEWFTKVEWVFPTLQVHELGKHAADVLRERIEAQQAEIAELKQKVAGEQFTAEQAVEYAQAQQTGIVRATVAACMEAAGLTTLSMNLDAQRTIWDRWEFETARNPEHTHVTFSLFQR